MSIIDGLKREPKQAPPAMAAPSIASKLRTVEAALEAQEVECEQLAYDVTVGAIAQSALDDAKRELFKLRNERETLEAAHRVAVQRDEATMQAQRASLRKTQLAAARKHLEARDAAAAALSEALSDAAKHYRELVERSEKAIAACPIGATWPAQNEYRRAALHRLVAMELFRVSGSAESTDALPGAHVDMMRRNNPGAVQPLAETVSTASAYAIAKLTEFVKGAE